MEIIRRNSDYAFHALAALAGRKGFAPASAHWLAERAGVAEPFLRKLLQRLSRAGVVESALGARGGFRLARRPERISVLEVLEAVQGRLAINRCFLGRRNCPRRRTCRISGRLTGIQKQLTAFFKSVKLADLVRERSRP